MDEKKNLEQLLKDLKKARENPANSPRLVDSAIRAVQHAIREK